MAPEFDADATDLYAAPEHAFAEWVRPHLSAMARLAARLAPGADRDDIVQEALTRAWLKRATFDPARGEPSSWLLAITADRARKASVRPRLLHAVPDAPGGSSPEDSLDLRHALDRLTRRQRLAVECFYFVGLSVAETSAVMRCSDGTVKSTLADARAKLRIHLEVSADPIDNLLNAAGSQWRSAQPAPPEPDQSRWSLSGAAPRRWIPLGAAAAVLLIVGSVGYGVMQSMSDADQERPLVSAEKPGTYSRDHLVLRDGDEVQARGEILATPGRGLRFCPPELRDLVLRPEGNLPLTCRFGVPVTGVSVDTKRQTTYSDGARSSAAALKGIWRGGELVVTSQLPPRPAPPTPPLEVPCDTPVGGWRNTGQDTSTTALHDYVVKEHPDQFRYPWMAGPDGAAQDQLGSGLVMVVEVVRGDAEKAEAALRQRYSGALCVVARIGRSSLADSERITAALVELAKDDATGIIGISGDGGGSRNPGRVSADVKLVTPALLETLATAGLQDVELQPWLRPLR